MSEPGEVRERVTMRLRWSVLLVPGFMMLAVALLAVRQAAPGYPTFCYWLAGVTMTVLLATSVLAHELAHVVVARHLRARVERMSLGLGGGITELADEPRTPRAELLITAAGPAADFGLGGASLALAAAGTMLGLPRIVLACLVCGAMINGILAVVNLLPGPSTDGSQLLYAALWRHTGDPARALAAADRLRRALGGVLLAAGVGLLLISGVRNGLLVLGLVAFVARRADFRRSHRGQTSL